MFIKTCTRKKGNKTYKTHYLAEGYRDKETGKVKHKHVLSLNKMPAKQILALKASLSGNSQVEKFRFEDLEIIDTREYGNVRVFEKLFNDCFSDMFSSKYQDEIKAITINKIFDPKSKNALGNWLRTVDMNYCLSNRNKLYEAIDHLEESQETVEKKLARGQSIKKGDLLLYDVTSTYFEGKAEAEICKRGYSRDHRGDRKQINIGLVTADNGTPLGIEVFAGNVLDKTTLQGKVDELKKKFNLKNITFVFDRGMKSTVNLKYLREQGFEYITALTHAELKKKCDENESLQMGLFDKNRLAEFEINEKKYALSYNRGKAKKDNLTRLRLIEKTEAGLKNIQKLKRSYTAREIQGKVSKKINAYSCEKYITYEIKETNKTKKIKDAEGKVREEKIAKLVFNEKRDKIEKDELYDGFYMVESSNDKISGKEAEKKYKSLQLVERAFDSMKNHIEIRPMFHFTEKRIKGHVFSCFLSYYLLHKFKQRTKELLKENTLDTLLTELRCIHKSYLKVDKFIFEKINNLNDIQKQLLKIFKIRVL